MAPVESSLESFDTGVVVAATVTEGKHRVKQAKKTRHDQHPIQHKIKKYHTDRTKRMNVNYDLSKQPGAEMSLTFDDLLKPNLSRQMGFLIVLKTAMLFLMNIIFHQETTDMNKKKEEEVNRLEMKESKLVQDNCKLDHEIKAKNNVITQSVNKIKGKFDRFSHDMFMNIFIENSEEQATKQQCSERTELVGDTQVGKSVEIMTLDGKKIMGKCQHDCKNRTDNDNQGDNTTTKCCTCKHNHKETSENGTQTDAEAVTGTDVKAGCGESCRNETQPKMKKCCGLERIEVDKLKLESNLQSEPDEVANIKAQLSHYMRSESDEISSRVSSINLLKAKFEKSSKSVVKDLLSTRYLPNIPNTISLYMQSSIGDIPWQWLKEEIWRIRSFAKYPSTAPKSALSLAADGFVYTGSGSDDIVECYFCHKTKKNWCLEDIIHEVHRLLSPDCPMVTGAECNNVPCLNIQTQTCAAAANKNTLLPTLNDDLETDAALDATQSSSLPRSRPQAQASLHEKSGNPSSQNTESNSTSRVSTPLQTQQISQPSVGAGLATSENGTPDTTVIGPNISQTQRNAPTTQSMPAPSTHSTNPPSFTASPLSMPSQSNQTNVTLSTPAQSNPTNIRPPTSSESSHPPPAQTTVPMCNPTYNDLGIITERPKRTEFAVREARFKTFEPWPRGHHISKETLADAGFYYAGYSDCARCFYCGGGLRNWEDNDNVWVEHARWFPKCAFMKQTLGTAFINAVQDLNKDHEEISFKMVTDKMDVSPSYFAVDAVETALKKDAAVKTVVGLGYREDLVIEVAKDLKDKDALLSADLIFDELQKRGHHIDQAVGLEAENIEAGSTGSAEPGAIQVLRDQNNQLRQQTLCKICLDNEVTIVFLPCGHLVSCSECAPAMKDCPVCRKNVKGLVRAFIN